MILTKNDENSSSMTKISLAAGGQSHRGSVQKASPHRPTQKKVAAKSDSRKPFFIMDFLDEVDPQDLEYAQRLLKTPQKPNLVNTGNNKSTSPFSLVSFLSKAMNSPPRSARDEEKQQQDSLSHLKPTRLPQLQARNKHNNNNTNTSSYFRKRSIAVGNGWNAKGLAKAKLGLWQDALACWENALTVRTQVLGANHIDVANTCNNMGIAVGKLNQSLPKALGLLQQALEIRQDHYGKEHIEVAATLHNIGNVLQQSGDWKQAVEYFEQAKDLQRILLGEEHVHVARAWRAMGHAQYQGLQYQQAHRAYCEALHIFERLREGTDAVADEIEATRADVHELNELMHQQACKRSAPKLQDLAV